MIRLVQDYARVTLAPALGGRFDATPEEREWLRTFLSFNVTEWRGGRPRTVALPLSLRDGSFPGGLLPLVEAAARDEGHRVESTDARLQPCTVDRTADLAWLRPYQREAIESVIRNVRGTVKITTGGGKGEIIVGLCRLLPCPWVVLVHRSHLLADLAARFERRTGERAGIIGEGRWDPRRVTFATFATLVQNAGTARGQALYDSTRGIIVDEVHVAPADSYAATLDRFTKTYWRVGFSGTPFARGDRRSILVVAHVGPMIYELKADALADAGAIVLPDIRMLTCVHTDDADGSLAGADWPHLYRRAIVQNHYRNALAVKAALGSPGPRMLFVRDLKHGDELLNLLRAEGARCRFAEGNMPLETRQRVIADCSAGRLDAVVASVVFVEGVDIPGLRTIVVAAAGMSAIAAVQRIGRATRAVAGKTHCDVWDFDDKGHPTLEKHSRARRRAYLREGYSVTAQEILALPTLPGITP